MGIKIYNAGINGVRLSKGITVAEFKLWIVSTLGGSTSDYYQSVIQSHDGGYIAVGYQNSEGQGSSDALITKYDSNLNVMTQKGLGGSGNDYYYSVIQSHDGGYIAVGYQNSEGQGSSDALITKYDSDLDVVTQKGLGGSGNDYYQSVIQSHDGGYIAVGYQRSEGQGNYDALITKYDSDLNVVTQKGLGGSNYDYYYSVIQSHDGGYITVGYQNSEGQGNYDALITKYDSDLNVVTQKGLGGSSVDRYHSVIQSHDGGYIAVGYQQSEGQGSSDALITKYDSDLNVVTQKGLGGSSYDFYHSVIQSHDGGYIAVGYQNSEGQGSYDALITKYDSDLNVMTQKGLGGSGSDFYQSVIPSHDGGYITVGYQQSEGQGSSDALITKLPSDLLLIEDGVLNGHPGLQWTTPSLTETTPSLIETTPSLIVTTPSLTVTTPSLTETTPSLTATRSEKQ